MSKERLKQFKDRLDFLADSADMDDYHRLIDTLENLYKDGELDWIHRFASKQSGRVQELEIYVDENSKKHANLNVFLQERDTTSTLGKHVVDAVMQYTQELERQNKRYREAILKVVGADNLSPYQKRTLNEGLEGDPHD